MAGRNCWEFKECGRQPGGANARELGVCRASAETWVNGTNGGRNGGRACWAIAGTLCGGKVQGTFAAKAGSCLDCEFYHMVGVEEGADHVSTIDIVAKLRHRAVGRVSSRE